MLIVVLCASKVYYKETKWETFLKFGTLPSWNFSLFELIKMGKFSHMSQPFNFYKIHLNFNLKLYESQTFSLQTIGREESSSVSLLPHWNLVSGHRCLQNIRDNQKYNSGNRTRKTCKENRKSGSKFEEKK